MGRPRASTILAILTALASLTTRADAKSPKGLDNPYPGYQSETYADPAHWLCRPDKDDVCDHDMDATIVKANGKLKGEKFRAARKPKIDCFYIYPTISTDPGGNSDLVPSENDELFVVRQQAAHLGAECRVFAPVYRQVTLTALLAALTGGGIPFDLALPYADVVDAWKHYVANDSEGRGVILIGHSQGAGILTTLIQNEIDPFPELRARLVSAMLLGTSLQVPDGADVGGDLKNIPLCRKKNQVGCAISYGSFRSTAPPPSNSFFGTSGGPGLKAACTNPAALSGGVGTLHPYFPTNGATLAIITVPPPEWVDRDVTIATPFVSLPKFVDAECVESNGFSYLSLIVHGNPSDPRIDDIGGDITPQWGMHLIDVNVAMGDLVSIAHSEARAYRRRR